MNDRPFCLVLMPFGRKPDESGGVMDFDLVYQTLIMPAVEAAGMQAIRLDEMAAGGLIHKAMFEALVSAPYAVVDLTSNNAGVSYELGIRHCARPDSTVLIAASTSRLVFDVSYLGVIRYELNEAGRPKDPQRFHGALALRLRRAREGEPDSPVYQLLDMKPPEFHPDETEAARWSRAGTEWKNRISEARYGGPAELAEVERTMGDLSEVAPEVLLELFQAYQRTGGWREMVQLAGKMPPKVADTSGVQEQLALALNRLGERARAEEILIGLLQKHGPSSETCGILGRVYKDLFDESRKSGAMLAAAGYLERAIDAYLLGFEADWRDPYPGLNAVTLMDMRSPPDERRVKLLPVVRYAVERKIAKAGGKADYWDFATQMQLAVLADDEADAKQALLRALPLVRNSWEADATVRYLSLLRSSREQRNTDTVWIKQIEETLAGAASQLR